MIASAVSLELRTEEARAATGNISGRVFVDGGGDGVFNGGSNTADGSDIGAGGLEVRAFDSTGAQVGMTTTTLGQDTTLMGTYQLRVSNSASTTVRVEFSTPVGYESTLTTSATSGSGTSIRFVEIGATNVDYGIFVPADYCQKNQSLAVVCINQGHKDVPTRNEERSISLTSFEPASTGRPRVAVNQDSATALSSVARKVDTGATWGLGWQKTTQLLWNSAVIRRHAGLGPEGIGGVYVYKTDGTKVASFDLTSATDVGSALTLKAPTDDYSDAARDIVVAPVSSTEESSTGIERRTYDYLSRDIPGFAGVGTAGLGDLDISRDGQYLWVTNLYERKIHRIAIGGTATTPTLGAVTSWSTANGHTCAGGTGALRSWGLDTNADGTIVVGAVCTNEGANPATKSLPGDGVIMKLDPTKPDDATAWSVMTTFGFDYAHNYDFCTKTPLTCTWKAWSSSWADLEPVADKESANSQYWWTQPMIVDVEQLGDGSLVLGISDRFSYQMGANNWVPVQGGTKSTVSGWTAGDTLLLCRTATGWAREANGDCAGLRNYVNPASSATEFFYDDFGHPETTIGGLALGRGQVAVTAMDPATTFLSGIRWVSTYDGRQTNALNVTSVAQAATDPGFGKSSGMGDVESLCDAAPLQIGNRVWYDDDRDGIQDPGEDPVVGVTVHLYDASQVLVGTAITNAKGEYYFSSNVTEAANGGATPDEFGGGLATNTAYTVVLDNPDDCAPGKPLEGFVLTYEDKNTTAGPPDRDQLIDSDAVPAGVDWCGSKTATVTVAPMSVGGVNHSYDIGFWKEGRAPVNADPGTNDPSTTDPDSTDPSTTVPGSTGVDAPATTVPSVGVAGVTATVPGTTIKVSVGDYVWWDLDRDGIQDARDIPIEGAVLTIKKVDGSAVTDVFGKPVTTTVTDANGRYSFDNLPPGRYTVTVTPPMTARTTKALAGKDVSKDSSTGSATSVVLTADGQRDPTLDFGFYKPSVSVGNFVWRDVKGDGLQNISDKGLAGFKLTIKTVSGRAVTDVYGRAVRPITTKADGKYLFEDLPPGRYEVFITYPRGWMPTTSNRPDRARNSSTSSTLSNRLRAGESDLTLDFGVVSRPGELYRALPSTR